MATRTFRDWPSWRDGLRSCMMRAGATAVVTQLTALGGTNAIASMQIPGLTDIGLHWKTALVSLVVQFVFHSVFAAASYIQNNPDPKVITETVETTFNSKNPTTGAVISQGSKITTVTPVAAAPSVPDADGYHGQV